MGLSVAPNSDDPMQGCCCACGRVEVPAVVASYEVEVAGAIGD